MWNFIMIKAATRLAHAISAVDKTAHSFTQKDAEHADFTFK